MKPSVLYITRNGMLEPLGQSQVLAYLRGLSSEYRITLISFEKPQDLANQEGIEVVRADCEAHGIRWLPQRFRYRPRIVAPSINMLALLWLCLHEVRRGNADLIHARSYIPAAVALLVHRLTRAPFIFDMRALWPEELITAGRLRRGSVMHRIIMSAERTCLRRAAAVVSLTHAAKWHLQCEYSEALVAQQVTVIPTCADLKRFLPAAVPPAGPRIYGCLGTVLSGWFRLDLLARFLRLAAARDDAARFQVITRDDALQVRRAVDPGSNLLDRLDIYPLPSDRVHSAVQQQHVSVMFFSHGLSKLGSSPTRMGEILGCGLPVVANRGVGDVANIIEQYRVGVLVEGDGEHDVMTVLDALDTLMMDPDLAARCRRAAEEVFSLEAGTAAYRQVYRDVLQRKGGSV